MWDLKHLQNIKSGYWAHFFFAMWFNLLAVGILITGVIHAFIPWLFAFTPYHLAQKIVRDTEKYIGHVKRY